MAESAQDMTREAEKVRQQKALDMCDLLLFIETKEEHIICSEHGVQYPTVPWAYGAAVSRRISTGLQHGWPFLSPGRLSRNTSG